MTFLSFSDELFFFVNSPIHFCLENLPKCSQTNHVFEHANFVPVYELRNITNDSAIRFFCVCSSCF